MFSILVAIALVAFCVYYIPKQHRKIIEDNEKSLREHFAVYPNEEAQKMMRAAGYNV